MGQRVGDSPEAPTAALSFSAHSAGILKFSAEPIGRPVVGAEVKVLGPEGDLKDSCSKQAREHDGLTNRRQSELPASQQDPLRHCRRCEFQEICQKFCTQYFE